MKYSKRIQEFIELVANVMESYTTALFALRHDQSENIHLRGYYSLSKNVIDDCSIAPGEGIVGWVLREQKTVLVNNFERDTKTLKFYSRNEEIKSFIAVPLPDAKGVLCADSKKSYLFTERKEKIFNQMAATALSLIEADRERAEKKFIEKLLDMSWKIDKIMLDEKKNDLMNEFLKIIAENMFLSHIFVVYPNGRIQSCSKEKGKTVIKVHEKDFFQSNGLMGWSLRNGKKIVMDKFVKSSDKSFIINKTEEFGLVHNFVGIPVQIKDTEGNQFCFGFIKEKERGWGKKEIYFLEGALNKMSSYFSPVII